MLDLRGSLAEACKSAGATITMRFARFTIADLVQAVLLCAVAMAGLMFASTPWGAAALSVALAVLTLAPLGIIYRRGERRAFWTGVVLCGWAYLTLSSGPWFIDFVRPKLITSRMLEWAYPWLIPPNRQASNPRFQLRPFDLPAVSVEGGLTIEQLNGSRVDVWIKKDGEALPPPLVLGAATENQNREQQCHLARRSPGRRRPIRKAGGGESLPAAVRSEAAHTQPA